MSARNNNAGIRCSREPSVLKSGVICARNNNAWIRCALKASMFGSGVPGTSVQGITMQE